MIEVFGGGARSRVELGRIAREQRVAIRLEALGMRGEKSVVDRFRDDEPSGDGLQEGEIAARHDPVEAVADPGPEDRALGSRRDPIALEPGFVVGVHDEHACALRLRLVQVLHGDGLVVRRVAAEEHDEVSAVPIAVAAGRRRDAEHPAHRGGRRAVAEPRGAIDVRAADRADRLLNGVVDLVADAA